MGLPLQAFRPAKLFQCFYEKSPHRLAPLAFDPAELDALYQLLLHDDE